MVDMNVPNWFIGCVHSDDLVARILAEIDLEPACDTLRLASYRPLLSLMFVFRSFLVLLEARHVIAH
jgi:hypothetical protein